MKVVVEDTMFIPNYEDYDKVGTNTGAAVFPQLWPEEMAGEGAIYRWQKFLSLQHHTMSTPELVAYFKRLLTPEEKEKYQEMVSKAMAWLAERCGWRMKNEWAVKEWGAKPIYVTDQPIEDWWRKPWKMSDIHVVDAQPHKQQEGIHIDMKALADHMGDMMSPSFQLRHDNKDFKAPSVRKELQDLVCSMLAKDNGWKEVEPYRINKTFYRIV